MCFTSMMFQLALTTLLLTAFLPAGASAQADRVIVVSISGDWKYQGTRVSFGQPLPAQGCLFGSDGSVVLQPDKKDASPEPFVCEKPSRDKDCKGYESAKCAAHFDTKNWKGSGSTIGNLWGAVSHLFTAEPEKYMVAASRGLEPALADAVVPLQDHSVDVSPAFHDMEAGEYWVKVESLEASAKPVSGVFEVRFVKNSPAKILVPAIQPGLYRLRLVDKAGADAGSDCWMLVNNSETYSSTAQAFRRAVQDSSSWPDAMDSSAVRALLRAYLESLAISGGKKPS